MEPRHQVTVRAGRKLIENWTSYDLSLDLLTPADSFSLQLAPADPVGEEFGEVWSALEPDAEVEVRLDDVTLMTGLVDEREGVSDERADVLEVSGRDRCGRLVDESMPLVGFAGLRIEDLARQVAGPWFERVELSNAINRRLLAGAARGAKLGGVVREPPPIDVSRRPHRKVEPGESRWAVLEHFLREAELLAWSSGDGRSLIVGRANYEQAPTFRFFHARAGSPRESEANCARFQVKDSNGERYSRVIAMGANAGNAQNYGERVVKRRGVVLDGPGPDGIGSGFKRPKTLLIADDGIHNDEQARVRAERELAERNATGHQIVVRVYGHSQMVPGGRAPTIYACDTMASVESEVFGVRGLYLITSVRFTGGEDGEMTEIQLVPKGTRLAA